MILFKKGKSKNKHCYIIANNITDFGGKERYIHDQANFFKNKFKVTVMLPNTKLIRILNNKDIRIINIKNKFSILINIILCPPNAVIIHEDIPFSLLLLLLLFKPKIYTFYHTTISTSSSKLSRKYFGFIKGIGLWKIKRRFRDYLLHRNCHKIIFPSSFLENIYLKLMPLYGEKFMVIHPWVDIQKFHFNKEYRNEIRSKLNIPPNAVVFLFVGRVCDAKRVDRFLGAFLLLRKRLKRHDIYCVIIGCRTKEELKVIPGYNNILVLEPKPDIENWYSIGDIFVLSSDRETFSFAVLEAMSCGLYPVVTDVADWRIIFNKLGVGRVSERNVYDLKRNMESALHTVTSGKSCDSDLKNAVAKYFGAGEAMRIQDNLLIS